MAAADRPFLSGIILAAGASTRMGRPKQLLPLGDRCLLQHVLDAAVASRLDEIVLVLGVQAKEVREAIRLPDERSIRVVVNPDYAQGQSSSLRLGLRSASPQSVAAGILLGDQPRITRQLIDRMAEAFLAAGSAIVRPLYAGASGRAVPGHPVFLARRIWLAAEQLEGDEGARVLMSAHPEWVTEIPVDGEPPGDIDTQGDYERAVDTVRGETIRASGQIEPGRR